MLTRFRDWNRGWLDWPELGRGLALLEALQRDTRGLTGDSFPMALSSGAGHIGAELVDAGEAFELYADVPGLTESDLDVTLDRNVLTLSGQRQVDVPEGFTAQRRERQPVQFSRSFTLPREVDAERTSATVADGVLTVRLAKLPEVQPRRITIKTH